MQQSLFQHLQQGGTVITPNRRLAAQLLSDFCTLSPGVSKKPVCLPYQSFLETLFQSNAHLAQPMLLSDAQTRALWVSILSTHELFCPQGLLDELITAWNHCQRWMIDFNHPSFSYTPQTLQFQAWSQAFQSRLDAINAITVEQLVPFFLGSVDNCSASQVTPTCRGLSAASMDPADKPQDVGRYPTTIIWLCFEDFTPSQKSLQDYLRQQGCSQSFLDLSPNSSKPLLYAADNEENEYQALVSWIETRILQGDKRIGVVVPDLQNKAERLQRLFEQGEQHFSYNISLGKPLLDFPLVAHALFLLKLNQETLSNQELCLLLASPFIAHSQEEKMARMQCLQDCPLLSEETIAYAQCVTVLSTYTPKLANLLRLMDKLPESLAVYQWVDVFSQKLHFWGFPGEYPLNSESYQCYNRFLALFNELLSLSAISPIMTKTEALLALETLAANTLFQAKTPNTTIQVLGLLEATGSSFDSLWVSNMTDDCLLKKTRLSAFIPAKLQTLHEMPHASPARELRLATKIIERLKNSSPHTIFSYPKLSKDKPNLVCPLLAELPPYTARKDIRIKAAPILEYYQESYQLPFSPNEKKTAGSAVLANQAKCPFRAFVSARLHVRQKIEKTDGLSPIERGNIIHTIMESIWTQLENQENLLNLPTSDLERLIAASIDRALEPYKSSHPYSFPQTLYASENKRLSRLIHAALAWEKSRPPFAVSALEQSFTLDLAEIQFKLRVDRIDVSNNGKKWIIDYKSTLPSALPWNETRPKEPQLLLYALLDANIDTLIFSVLKEGHSEVKGLSQESLDMPGVQKQEGWEETRSQWQDMLTKLAEEYAKGFCPPQPLSPEICQQCDFQSLCRFRCEGSA